MKHICKYLSDSFYPKWYKTRRCLFLLVFNFAFECVIKKVQKNQVGLNLNGTHQLVAYADDVNLLGDNINTINEST
jgi:hypothetical protein